MECPGVYPKVCGAKEEKVPLEEMGGMELVTAIGTSIGPYLRFSYRHFRLPWKKRTSGKMKWHGLWAKFVMSTDPRSERFLWKVDDRYEKYLRGRYDREHRYFPAIRRWRERSVVMRPDR
jgi:hypothetical protein